MNARAILQDIFEQEFGSAALTADVNASFFELGADSLVLSGISRKIQDQTGVNIPFRTLMESHNTFELLAEYLDQEMPESLPEPQPEVNNVEVITEMPTPIEFETPAPLEEFPPLPVQPETQIAATVSGNSLDRLLQGQMQLMQKQLDVLKRSKSQSVAQPAQQAQQVQQAFTANVAPAERVSSAKRPAVVRPGAPEKSSTIVRTETKKKDGKKPFIPYKKIRTEIGGKLTDHQQNYLDNFIKTFNQKTKGSKQIAAESRKVISDNRLTTGFRKQWKELIYPISCQEGKEARMTDVDGNEYVDLVMGFGSLLFGHTPDFLQNALREQMDKGIQLGPYSAPARLCAKRICEMTGMESVSFVNSGTEAVMAALRMARTVTGKNKVVIFEGSFHGTFDGILVKKQRVSENEHQTAPMAPGTPQGMVDDMIILDYCEPESLKIIEERADELAAVLIEPCPSRNLGLEPKEFLEKLRVITKEKGVAFISDETISGCRFYPGGIQGAYNLDADLVVLGKAIAGGSVPVALVAGKYKFMDCVDGGDWNYGDDSFPEAEITFHVGTYFKHPLAIAGIEAVMKRLQEDPTLQEKLNGMTKKLVDGLNRLFIEEKVPIETVRRGSAFQFVYDPLHPFLDLLFYFFRDEGVLLSESRVSFISTAHQREDIDRILKAMKNAIRRMKEGDFLSEAENDSATVERIGEVLNQYPLTELQKQIWISAQLSEEHSVAYNESQLLYFSRPVDANILESAIQQAVERYESMRAIFSDDGSYLEFSYDKPIELELFDCSHIDEENQRKEAEAIGKTNCNKPFDMETGPLLRAGLITLNEKESLFYIAFHHIITDALSTGIFLEDVSRIYEAEQKGVKAELKEPFPFRSYLLDEKKRSDANQDSAETFWKDILLNHSSQLDLPFAAPRANAQTFSAGTVTTTVSSSLYNRLREIGTEEGATLYTTLLAAFGLLLHRLSREERFLLGIHLSGHSYTGSDTLVGCCLNTVPFPCSFDQDSTFTALMEKFKNLFLDIYEYQAFPVVELERQLDRPVDTSRPPLFCIDLNLNREMGDEESFLGQTVETLPEPIAYSKMDLTLYCQESDHLEFLWCYNSDLFDQESIERMAANFETLLWGVVENKQENLSKLPLLTNTEKEQVLTQWNDTDTPFPDECCIHELFEEQSTQTPDAIALICEEKSLTYRELNEETNRLAHYLVKQGVKPDTIVGVCMERSIEMVIALMGIVKAGAAYLPLDPEYPSDRLAYMLEDSNMTVLLNQEHLTKIVPINETVQTLTLDSESGREELAQFSVENLPIEDLELNSQNLAYVIYTSGSTGKPKGVLIEHHSLINRLLWMQKSFQLTEKDRVLQKTPYSFDVSVWEFFWPLITGAQLVMAKPGGHKDSQYLVEIIEKQGITTLHFVPSMLRLLLEEASLSDCDSLRQVICSGEALPADLVKLFHQTHQAELHNLYGPTEATIDVTWYPCQRGEELSSIPIGKPIDNTQLYVLDNELQAVPVGASGELHLAGVGLSRGYLNRPELTEEKFIANPFSKIEGDRLYKTGDLVRYLPDGNVEFIGRIDHQVKVRGFRIELGEIETAILKQPNINDCVVVAREETPGDYRLIAYITTDNTEGDSLIEKIREELRSSLPEYMIPSAFVTLEKLPLTGNGKVNRKALPAPSRDHMVQKEFKAPSSKLEEMLLKAWKTTLNQETISIHDNFFDIGGHSLTLIRLRNDLAKRLGRKIEITKLFEYPTIHLLANYLEIEEPQGLLISEKDIRKKTREISQTSQPEKHEIAIIGMYGRFPVAKDLDQFWQNLKNGVEAREELSDETLREAGVAEALINHPNYVKSQMTLEAIDQFDGPFFGYTPKEAEVIDPQQRLMLEGGWSLMENAGYNVDQYDGWVGVFAGASYSSYLLDNLSKNSELIQSVGFYPILMGNDKDFVATKLSYHLGLKGPAVTVQTACSTSLVAVHMASESLRNRECDMAIAGAASISSIRNEGYLYAESGIASPDGHCRPFDEKANGMTPGSGVGMVLLKRLSDAIQDRDSIQAVIKGSAINNDGNQKAGFTAPSIQGQSIAILNALENANVSPETISYVEAHGTGTALGDPIEVAALTQVYQQSTQKTGFCALGSVKSNVGHLDAAAGVTGLIKTVLSMKHGWIPPTVHFQKPNPEIDFENSPFYVADRLTEWKSETGPRRAAVSSFGLGGTNSHLILEEAPIQKNGEENDQWKLLPISAKSGTALNETAENLKAYLTEKPDINLNNVAYTLQQGRKAFEYRQTLTCRDLEGAISQLKTIAESNATETPVPAEGVNPVFMFPGQGAQYPNMALEIYQNEPIFQETVNFCCDLLQPIMGLDLRTILFPTLFETLSIKEAADKLQQTWITQPALFVIEYGLAKLWISLGVKPSAMIGHSIGEYVAATLAGVLTPESALKLVATRGRLIQDLPGGTMISLTMSRDKVEPFLNESLSLAASNGPELTVLSGTNEAVETLREQLKQDGIAHVELKTSHAFHSCMMDPILKEFQRELEKVTFNAPEIPYISNVTGDWITEEEVKAHSYWVKHLRGTVLFHEGVQQLIDENRLYLEVGPGTTLGTFLKRLQSTPSQDRIVASLRHPNHQCSDMEFFYRTIGKAWSAGLNIDWNELSKTDENYRIPLPTYPFEHQSYWVGSTERFNSFTTSPSLRKPLDRWFYQLAWKVSSMRELPKQSDPSRNWLIFMDDKGIGEQFKQALESQGENVTTVNRGTSYKKVAANEYEIGTKNIEEYETFLQTLKDEKRVPTHIAHLWNVTDSVEINLENLSHFREASFDTLLIFMKSWDKINNSAPLQLGLISNHVRNVLGTEQLNPAKSLLQGSALAIPPEFPNVNVISMDVDWDEEPITEKETNTLMGELLQAENSSIIAWRKGLRFEPDFKNIDSTTIKEENEQEEFKEGGVYLLTGGLGGIALTFVETISKSVSAKFALLGRSNFPERATWNEWLNHHDENDATSQKIRRLLELEAMGAELMVLQADCSNLEETKKAVSQVTEQFGTVNGVIHAAGIAKQKTMLFGTEELFQNELAAKVTGTCVLQEVFKDQKLDFLLLCSSVSSHISSHGLFSYGAGNFFMDTFAHNHDSTLSINWPTWSDVGMAFDMRNGDDPDEAQALDTISPKEGGNVLNRLIGQKELKNVIVLPLNPDDFRHEVERILSNRMKEEEKRRMGGIKGKRFPRPNLSVEYTKPENEVEESVIRIYEELLGFEQVGTNDDFFELGGQSLLATALLTRIRDLFDLEISMSYIFENSTPAKIAKHIIILSKTAEELKNVDGQLMENEMELEL